MHVLIYVLKIEKLKQESVIYSTINYGFFHIVISAVTDVLIIVVSDTLQFIADNLFHLFLDAVVVFLHLLVHTVIPFSSVKSVMKGMGL